MSHEDPKVTRVAPDFTWLDDNASWPRPESQLGFTQERWDKYRQLFRTVGSDTGFSRTQFNHRGEILKIALETSGLVTGGTEKGFACSVIEPAKIVASNEDEGNKGSSGWRFKHLDGCWYIYSNAF
jgi:hypothetical protein